MIYIEEDSDIVAMTDNNKVLFVNTSKIPLKATKNTQGVQVMSLGKRGAKLSKIYLAADSGLEEPKKYAIRNIPSAGSTIKKEDTQLSLL